MKHWGNWTLILALPFVIGISYCLSFIDKAGAEPATLGLLNDWDGVGLAYFGNGEEYTFEITDWNSLALSIDANAPDIVFRDDNSYPIDIVGYTDPGKITFVVEDYEILFEWNNGKFNVVYDANNCTKAADTFFECILPYLNKHIKQKAELLKEKNK